MPSLVSTASHTLPALLCCACLCAPSSALAQPSPSLPAVGQLSALVSALREQLQPQHISSHISAASCTIKAESLDCRCVTHTSGWRFERLQIAPDGAVTLTNASLIEADARWALGSATITARAWRIRSLLWWREGSLTLRIGAIERGEERADLLATQLGWFAHTPQPNATSCPSYSLTDDSPLMRAQRASGEPDGWRLESLHMSWLELAGASGANERRDGVLPPTLRANGDGFEYTHATSWRALPVLPELLVSPRRWYGLGALLPPTHAATQRPLEAALLWSQDAGLTYALFGQALLGEPSGVHLSADLEMSPDLDMARELRRVEQQTWLRTWRARRLGASLSTDSLLFHAAWSGDDAPWALGSNSIGLALADAITLDETSRVEGRLEHWTSYGEEQAKQHRSAALLGWSTRWGSSDRADALLGLFGAMELEATDGLEAWRAQTSAAAAVYGQAGLHIRGRFESWTHNIAPRLTLLGAPSAIASPSRLVGQLSLSQRFEELDGGWYLHAPLTMWVDWRAERAESWRAAPLAHVAAGRRGALLDVRLSAALLCADGCAQQHGLIKLGLDERLLGLGAEAALGRADQAANLLFMQSAGELGGVFGADAMRRAVDARLDDPAPLQAFGLSWRGGRHTLRGNLWRSDETRGATGAYSFMFHEIGWGLSAQGGWEAAGRWSAWVGLQLQ